MNKGTTLLKLSLMSIFIVIAVASFSFADVSHHTTYGTSPANDTYTTKTNDTLIFVYNHTGVFADKPTCQLFLDNTVVDTKMDVDAHAIMNVTSNIAFTEGKRQWFVRCVNATLTETSVTRTFYADYTAPTITMNSPVDKYNSSSATVVFSVTIIDNVNSTNVTLYVDGIINTTIFNVVNNTATPISVVGFVEGDHNWNVTAVDNAGNPSGNAVNRTFIVDLTAPATVDIATINDTNTSTAAPNIVYNFTDALSTVATCTIYYNGASNVVVTGVVNNTPKTTALVAPVVKYRAPYYIECADSAGNKLNSTTYNITIDPVNPTVTLPSGPVDAKNFSVSGVKQINFTITDNIAQTGWLNATLYINGVVNETNITITNNTLGYFSPNSGEGAHNWYINAYDGAGNNRSTVTRTYWIDLTAPASVTINTAANKVFNTTTPTIAFTGIDAVSTILNCSITVDGTLNTQNINVINNTEKNVTLTTLVNKYNTSYYVTCKDNSGLSLNSSILNMTIDSVAPSVTINPSSPVSGYNYSSASPSMDINFTVTDNINQVGWLNASIWFKGVLNKTLLVITNNTPANITMFNIEDGTHSWFVDVMDSAGNNKSSTPRTVFVDSTPPALSSVLNINVSNPTGENMTGYVNYTVTDAGLTIDKCWMKIIQSDGTALFGNGLAIRNATGEKITACYFSFVAANVTAEGQFNIELSANDTFGNSVSTNYTGWTKATLTANTWNHLSSSITTNFQLTGNLSFHITHVSLWSNLLSTYTSYVKGLSANATTNINESQAIYVYTNKTVVLLRFTPTTPAVTTLVMYPGWNQIGLYNNTINLEQACDHTVTNATVTANITYVSTYRANESKYYTHRCGYTYYATVGIPRGTGIWTNMDAQATIIMTKP